MKAGLVPSSALAHGWEASVHLFAAEHGIEIKDKITYVKVKALMKLIDDIDELTAKKVDIALRQAKKRRERDKLKLELGYKKKE